MFLQSKGKELARGELQRKRSRVEYYSLKKEEKFNDGNEDYVQEDELSSLSDDQLIELIKDTKCRDKDSIIILLENRGYRVSDKEGKVKIHRMR